MEPHQHVQGGPLDYDKITDSIFIGSNQCCMTGLAEVLQKEGVTADISLEDIRLDHPFGVETYLWLPTPDHTPPTPDQLALGVLVIGELVRRNKKIYVHCQHGHGRAPTLVAAYLIRGGATAEEAESAIRAKRPSMHLQESQRSALREFYRALQP